MKFAITQVWPEVPRRRQAEVKKALRRIFYTANMEDALAALDQLVALYGGEFPTATEVLGQHLRECRTFYRFPERHWKSIRTGNVLEGALREVRRRTKCNRPFPYRNLCPNSDLGDPGGGKAEVGSHEDEPGKLNLHPGGGTILGAKTYLS